MARVTGPLLSFDAHGTISKELVYTNYRGANVVKKLDHPVDANSTAQQSTREIFILASTLWNTIPEEYRDNFATLAVQKGSQPRNIWLGWCVEQLRGKANFNSFKFATPTAGWLPVSGGSASAGVGSISGGVNLASWAGKLTGRTMHIACIRNANPYTLTDRVMHYAEGAYGGPNPTITGLSAGVQYAVGLFGSGLNPRGKRVWSWFTTTLRTPT